MRLISWNVNGIRAVQRKGALDWVWEQRPEIFCLQETKAWPQQLKRELLEPNGYKSYWDRAEKKGYSGTAIYTTLEPKKYQAGLGIERLDKEGRAVTLEFDDFVIFNVYFPNGQRSSERLDYKLAFYEVFLEHIESHRSEGKSVIFCGDVNTAHKPIDLARPKENSGTSGFLPIEREWIDKVIEHGYVDTFRHLDTSSEKYTWWDYVTRARERNVGWRIDYFFVSDDLLPKLKDAFIMSDVMGSDHCPIGIDIEF